jgi:endonuclease YncB( thermonuclease family)
MKLIGKSICESARWISIGILGLIYTSSVEAHPGSLDANGGHLNWRTGEYHSHSGTGGNNSGQGTSYYQGGSQQSNFYRPPFTLAPQTTTPYSRNVPFRPYFPPYWSPYRSYQSPKKAPTPTTQKSEPNFKPFKKTVTVVEVHDGDTIKVKSQEGESFQIRLLGIDSPELKQSFGAEAKTYTEEHLLGKDVLMDVREKDRYNRLVAEIMYSSGASFNRELVSVGLAHWYRQFAPAREDLRAAEDSARAQKLGVWALPSPVLPSDFRYSEVVRARLRLRN